MAQDRVGGMGHRAARSATALARLAWRTGDDALATLTGTAPWPDATLDWAAIDGRHVRLAAGSRW